MKFAIAKTVITPKETVYMAGFASREHKNTGVHDDIFAKVVLLKSNQPLLIVTLDALGGDRSFIIGIKEALGSRFGLKDHEILINFSHTHGSVYFTGEIPELRRGRYSIGLEQSYASHPIDPIDYSPDVAYYRRIKQILIDLVAECYDTQEEGTIQLGLGLTDISVSRRLPNGNGVSWAPNYDAVIDKDLFVIKILNEQGVMKGIIFSHGCHPTSMNNYEISAEFVGHACRCLEEHYPGINAVFLQGCAGEIKPVKSANGDRFKLCSFEEMMEIGTDLANDVIDIIETGAFHPIRPKFSSHLLDVKLYSQRVEAKDYEVMLQDPACPEIMRPVYTRLLAAMEQGIARDSLQLYISIWHLDEHTRVIALEGEISTEYALLIKKLFKNGKTIVLGYSNGMFTYIATRKMIGQGGYEVDRAPMSHGFIGPFVPEIEDIIIGSIVKQEFIKEAEEV